MAARILALGELEIARSIFGEAIDYAAVRVHNRGFTPFQPRRTAVTPLGAIHFRREDFKPDFSTTDRDAAWLIHELTHVWQHQTGQWVLLRGIFERRYQYDRPDPDRGFMRYMIEQQASIVEDYFRMRRGLRPHRGDGPIGDYERLIPFLPD